ncbi:unnamed protein product [Pleuronectes platessa]|uniref:Uncharacterized protein n=1 Tax=Pleuronectes platessa TaxID=8262 RepID=A0A9N7TQ07_PLEPL|nr:unnamed protein product [Pleuronectes platessa]
MNNRQAPENSPHPLQPTNHWPSSSPNVCTVKHSTPLWTESACRSVASPKKRRRKVLEFNLPQGKSVQKANRCPRPWAMKKWERQGETVQRDGVLWKGFVIVDYDYNKKA